MCSDDWVNFVVSLISSNTESKYLYFRCYKKREREQLISVTLACAASPPSTHTLQSKHHFGFSYELQDEALLITCALEVNTRMHTR